MRPCFAEGLWEFGAAPSDRSGTQNIQRGDTQRKVGAKPFAQCSSPGLSICFKPPQGLTQEGSPCPQRFLPVQKRNSLYLNVVMAPTFTGIPILHGSSSVLPWESFLPCLPWVDAAEPLSFPPRRESRKAAPGKSRVLSNSYSAWGIRTSF